MRLRAHRQQKLEDDEYTLKTIIVNQGDRVVVHFYNIEGPTGDKHSFTIGGPYKIDIDVAPGQNGTATFTADHTVFSDLLVNIIIQQ